MWIPRSIEPRLLRLARTQPVVVLTGADRQDLYPSGACFRPQLRILRPPDRGRRNGMFRQPEHERHPTARASMSPTQRTTPSEHCSPAATGRWFLIMLAPSYGCTARPFRHTTLEQGDRIRSFRGHVVRRGAIGTASKNQGVCTAASANQNRWRIVTTDVRPSGAMVHSTARQDQDGAVGCS